MKPLWFTKLSAAVRAMERVQLIRLPGSATPYQPAGLYAVSEPLLGTTPLLFSFPQPMMVLEALAAWRGFGGFAFTPECFYSLACRRASNFAVYTAILAEYLCLTPQQTRQAVHCFTPLNAPTEPWMPAGVPLGPRLPPTWCSHGHTGTSAGDSTAG